MVERLTSRPTTIATTPRTANGMTGLTGAPPFPAPPVRGSADTAWIGDCDPSIRTVRLDLTCRDVIQWDPENVEMPPAPVLGKVGTG